MLKSLMNTPLPAKRNQNIEHLRCNEKYIFSWGFLIQYYISKKSQKSDPFDKVYYLVFFSILNGDFLKSP